MFRSRLAALALAAAVVLVGCSSKAPSSAPATTRSFVTLPPTTAGSRASDDPFCSSLSTYNERFQRMDLGANDPQKLKSAMQEASAAISDAQGKAPEEIRSDVAVLSRGFQQFVTILEQANYDFTKLTLAQVQQLQTPEFTAAGQRVDTYLHDHC